MNSWKKRLFIISILLVPVLLLSGCFGRTDGGGGGSDVDQARIQKEITTRINTFKQGVEDYGVDKMLGFLWEPEFKLTIVEGKSEPYHKDLKTLRDELEEDQNNQQRWRKPMAEGGQGYRLDMKLDEFIWKDVKSTGTHVVVSFKILESADSIGDKKFETDKGKITFAMIKQEGNWYCQAMTINFEPMGGIDIFALDTFRWFGYLYKSFGN